MRSSLNTARLVLRDHGRSFSKSSGLVSEKRPALLFAAGASAIGVGVALSASSPPTKKETRPSSQRTAELWRSLFIAADDRVSRSLVQNRPFAQTTNCDDGSLNTSPSAADYLIEIEDDYLAGHTETERFFQTLDYHRQLLPDYMRRWKGQDSSDSSSSSEYPLDSMIWPRRVPTDAEVPALETDLKFCQHSGSVGSNYGPTPHQVQICQNLQFRIATYYLLQTGENPALQRKGYKMIKKLAESGHPDGMCMYGIILNRGKVVGVDVNPEQAAVWWRRCVDFHRHMTAMFELGVAYYTAEGVVERPELACKLFRRAAHLGHAGAAYMLGECLLDGVGIERDRGNALEWLVTAAELGHQLARERVIVVLNQDHDEMNAGHLQEDEALKWVKDDAAIIRSVNIEKRFTVGGGTRNPAVLARRQTIVKESRGEIPSTSSSGHTEEQKKIETDDS